MNHLINAGIQLVPLNIVDKEYSIINKAIDIISASGLEYTVTPFETVVNGKMQEVLQLIDRINSVAQTAGAEEFLINVKFHCKTGNDNLYQQKIQQH